MTRRGQREELVTSQRQETRASAEPDVSYCQRGAPRKSALPSAQMDRTPGRARPAARLGPLPARPVFCAWWYYPSCVQAPHGGLGTPGGTRETGRAGGHPELPQQVLGNETPTRAGVTQAGHVFKLNRRGSACARTMPVPKQTHRVWRHYHRDTAEQAGHHACCNNRVPLVTGGHELHEHS